MTRTIGVLISGRGSNLQAIIDAARDGRIQATVAVVISNRADAYGLERARKAGIEALCLPHRAYPSRHDYDRALVNELRQRGVDLVCLAGFMRMLGPGFVDAFPDAILNIHPSLLPSFPGLEAQRQALEHGVKVSGVTVHIVDCNLDAGPIVVQRAVAVMDDDTVESLSARILAEEHQAYPEAIRIITQHGWRVEGRRLVVRRRGAPGPQSDDEASEAGSCKGEDRHLGRASETDGQDHGSDSPADEK
jgi:phosphoribosylglycinamide formyltransferase-1